MNAGRFRLKLRAVLVSATMGIAPVARADRTKLKPGMNSFSPQQDIELGKKAKTEAEQKLPMCNAPKVDAYLTKLGTRLVEQLNTNGIEYPWEFHCVNDKSINAFALPGGYVFVNRGAIEAADNEAQLAGVMAHELSHVALRHGTNQATKAQYAQLGNGILGVTGSILGGTAGAAAAGAGQLAVGSVLLKYSRAAEIQADVMGTQVLYDAGYDPRAMAAFFENLEAQSAGKNPPEFSLITRIRTIESRESKRRSRKWAGRRRERRKTQRSLRPSRSKWRACLCRQNLRRLPMAVEQGTRPHHPEL